MPDIFDDLAKLELPETELLQTATAASTTVPFRKPRKDEWFRVNPDPTTMRTFLIYEDSSNNNKPYIVTAAAQAIMEPVSRKRIVYVAINRNNEMFLSPVGVGDDAWSISSRSGHQAALSAWVRLTSSRDKGEYVTTTATFANAPVFPPMTLNDLLRSAFGAAGVISDLNHHIVLNMLGVASPPPVGHGAVATVTSLASAG
jgi:hypothetical protein